MRMPCLLLLLLPLHNLFQDDIVHRGDDGFRAHIWVNIALR